VAFDALAYRGDNSETRVKPKDRRDEFSNAAPLVVRHICR
jgi:hypothetical protein